MLSVFIINLWNSASQKVEFSSWTFSGWSLLFEISFDVENHGWIFDLLSKLKCCYSQHLRSRFRYLVDELVKYMGDIPIIYLLGASKIMTGLNVGPNCCVPLSVALSNIRCQIANRFLDEGTNSWLFATAIYLQQQSTSLR